MDFVIAWIAQNSALLLSVIAITATVRANLIANGSRKLALDVQSKQEALTKYRQRTQLLEEIDRQHALLNRLATILLQKVVIYQQLGDSELIEGKIARLQKNLEAVEFLRGRYDEQRKLAETIDCSSSVDGNERTLAEIRRLTLHLEQDIENELSEMKDIEYLS